MNPDEIEGMGQGWMKRKQIGRLFLYLSKAPFSFSRGPRIGLRTASWGQYEVGFHVLPKTE